MPKPMTRKQAPAEARRLADTTEECQVIYVIRRGKEYGVMSAKKYQWGGPNIAVVGCAHPGEGE